MTSGVKEPSNRRLVTVVLPRLAGVGGLLVFLVTLNHWVSFFSLGTVMRISGWSWQPQLDEPLTALVLFPFRCLPQAWIPLALNLFTAVCAALVLAMLARTVALLPQDLTPAVFIRTKEPAAILSTPSAWIPPALAVMLCGLQLSFWEHATSASGEMIDLLVFGCVVWCLLEFRVGGKQAWLSRAALLFGAGMANNWVMVGCFPIFVIAVIRLKGLAFLNGRFLLRMTLWGLAGLSLYLLLPLLHSLQPEDQVNFWTALKLHLQSQKGALTFLHNSAFRVLTATSLLSLLLLSIPWKPHILPGGGDTRLGAYLTGIAGHIVHGLLLIGSAWVALDPVFSPRRLGFGTPLLIFYFFAALVAGYCAGYFLLISSGKFPWRWAKATVPALLILVTVMPLVLLWRNFGQIRMTNGSFVHDFARQLCADLPPGKSVALSDDPIPLYLARAELGARGKDVLLVETRSLFSPEYQEFMARHFAARWPVGWTTNRFEAMSRPGVVKLVSAFAARGPVVYLHPSSGLFFESFADEPNGFIHRLTPRGDDGNANQRTLDLMTAKNEQIWQQRWSNGLQRLARQTKEKPPPPPARVHPLLKSVQLPVEQNSTVITLGAAGSKALNGWGVRMQQLGRWTEAGVWFQRALELSPDNTAARINVQYNERCRRGDQARLRVAEAQKQIPDLFDKQNDWRQVLEADGPVDEPTFLLRTGRAFLLGEHYRQAAASFARAAELAPTWSVPKLWLAESYLGLGNFADVLALTDRSLVSDLQQNGPALSQLLQFRTKAMQGLGQTNEAVQCIESFVSQYGKHQEVLLAAANYYAEHAQFEPELALLDRMLQREPKLPDLLAMKGQAEMRLSRYDAAIATLTTALTIAPAHDKARLHRAVALLAAGQLEASARDYEALLRTAGHAQTALFGLGGIAWRKQDTNAAIGYYQRFLAAAVPGSPQYNVAAERLKRLQNPQVH